MDRGGADLGPRRDHPWATPAGGLTPAFWPIRGVGPGGGRLRLGPWRDHPWATPAAVMTETLSTMRVLGRGGGRLRRRTCGRGCLAQRDELQGRIHGPAHQRPQRALVLATVGHRGEHVFGKLRA